jgi:nicotinate dehydrogenase subunit B
VTGDQLDSYITIDADGTVVAYCGKIDGGQGLGTAIAQMVAEEIEVACERVRVVMGDSALDMGGSHRPTHLICV